MTSQKNDERKNFLEKKLKENSKKKLKIIWAIFVSIICPFILPFFPTKKSVNFATGIGYWNAVMLFGIMILIFMPYLIYKEYDQMKRNKYDIEREQKSLK